MPRDKKYQDVTIGDRKFRIGLVKAIKGEWIVTQMNAGRSGQMEVFAAIQSELLNVCSILVDAGGTLVPKSIWADGRWLDESLGLEYDLETVHDLFDAALKFNFDPFFESLKKKGEEALQMESQSSLSNQ